MKSTILNIIGMHCQSCAVNITLNLEKLPGIAKVELNYTAGKAYIDYDENLIDQEKIKETIVATGYDVAPDDYTHDHIHHQAVRSEKELKIKTIIALVIALPLLARMIWPWEIKGAILGIGLTGIVIGFLAFIVVFFLGWQFHKNAFRALARWQADMDSLISLGTLSAFFYSVYALLSGRFLYFDGAITITALILLGRYLELKTKGRASRAMNKIMELAAKKARIVNQDGSAAEKALDEIRINDILLVKPGEKIPLDGVVIDGQADIDESMLTGESLPSHKSTGQKVFAGTVNLDSVIKIKVEKASGDTVLAQIIKSVEDMQRTKAPIQRLADRVASIFVPVAIILSILTLALWLLIAGDFSAGVIAAVSVLVISCPCALGIATPIAVMIASSVGARNGILIKNNESFERAKKINTVIFDKTGTLTSGNIKVSRIISADPKRFSEEMILKIAMSLGKNSEHPLSKAAYEYAAEKKIKPAVIKEFKEITGQGLAGKCAEHNVQLLMGNEKLLSGHGTNTDTLTRPISKALEENGGTVLYVSHGGELAGALIMADTLKESAPETIVELEKLGIETIIISGGRIEDVAAVARVLGIKKYIAAASPEEKRNEVKKLQDAGRIVAFAGDGINDALSLMQADFGLAMASGSDIAKESGHVIIIKNDPIKIVEAIKLSQKTFSVIKQNLFWAFFYNIAAIPLAMLGLVSPMIAAAAMSISSLTVIANSLRLYRK